MSLKWRIIISAMWGLGLTLLVTLLMNLGWIIGILLLPGFLGVGVLRRPESMFVLFATNVIFYSLLAFVVIWRRLRNAPLELLRRIVGWSIFPAITLGVLACTNPLWPYGMADLARQESETPKCNTSGP